MMGIDSFDAIIIAPEAAILAVGRVHAVPEWREEKWVPKQVISCTLSVGRRWSEWGPISHGFAGRALGLGAALVKGVAR